MVLVSMGRREPFGFCLRAGVVVRIAVRASGEWQGARWHEVGGGGTANAHCGIVPAPVGGGV
eukprot:3020661-Prorocentrum_lima.AAC.1